MHQLCRLYVNRAIIINYSCSLFIPARRLSSRRAIFSPVIRQRFIRFPSFFIFFAMRFAYRAAERLFRGKVLP